ncbi:hypothetical protein EBB07_24885 [Paenibacillaceae bacterium]|nr:hypothetical protein EBB07_24885 [Paenibacillaceae bacterium]
MRTISRLLGICFVFVLLLSACQNDNTPPAVLDSGVFPVMEDIKSITIHDWGTDTVIRTITDQHELDTLAQGLQRAPASSIDDPEPSGQLFKIALSNDSDTAIYQVNDLRLTTDHIVSGKIYLPGTEGQGKAWKVTTQWIRQLLGQEEQTQTAEPLLYTTFSDITNSVVVQANRDMDKDSVTKTLERTLVVAGMPLEELDYTLYWVDDQRFVVEFANMKDDTSIHFRLDDIMSKSGEPFANKEHTFRNQVLLSSRNNNAVSRLKWISQDNELIRSQSWDFSAVLIQPVFPIDKVNEPVTDEKTHAELDAGSLEKLFVYHTNNTLTLIDPASGESTKFDPHLSSEKTKPFANNDYGIGTLMGDRFNEQISYAADANQFIYRVERKNGHHELLYTAPRPIYGIAVSPDLNHVAVLIASDEFVGPEADLIVLDSAGKEIYVQEKAAYISHSDGFLFVYPMQWKNNDTIVVPWIAHGAESFSRGTATIHLKEHTTTKQANPELPEEASQLLEAYTGGPGAATLLRVLPQPGGEQEQNGSYAVQTSESGSWLINTASNRVIWLGPTTLIGWANQNEVIVAQPGKEEFIYNIGIDG